MARTPFTVLCFGDSLTSGYHNYGLGEQPYSEVLTERLEAALPDRDVQVFTNGVPGDVASRQAFRQRLQRECTMPSVSCWCHDICSTGSCPCVIAG